MARNRNGRRSVTLTQLYTPERHQKPSPIGIESKHMKLPALFVRFSHLMGWNDDGDGLAYKSGSVSACYVLRVLTATGLCSFLPVN